MLQQPLWYLSHALYWHFFVVQETLLNFICDGFHLKDFLLWGLSKHDSSRWYIIPFSSGYDHHETAWCILIISQRFLFSSYIRGIFPIFSLFRLPDCFCILFDPRLCGSFTASRIVTFSSTIISGDVVKVSLRVLFILFFFTLIIPGFPTLCKHKLVVDTFRLVLPIRVIIRLDI